MFSGELVAFQSPCLSVSVHSHSLYDVKGRGGFLAGPDKGSNSLVIPRPGKGGGLARVRRGEGTHPPGG
jgi:hypothetical protein